MKPRPAIGRKPRTALPAAALLLAAALAAGLAPPAGAAGTRLDIWAEPFVDYYGYVRALATRPDSAALPEGLAPAVKGALALSRQMGSPVGWAVVDTLAVTCPSAADFRRNVAQLPDSLRLPGSPPVARAIVQDFADALLAGEPRFLESVWPAHKASLDAAYRKIERSLLPRWDAVLNYHLRSLGMTDPELTVPVYLVHDLPEPGAYTLRRRAGGVVFVAVGDLEGSLLLEVVIHETTHALDIATAREEQFLVQLRNALTKAGLGPADKAFRDLPHAVIFLQSAATVSRILDPDHVPYGAVRGVYSRLSVDASALLPLWAAYLDGVKTRDQVVETMVRLATAAK